MGIVTVRGAGQVTDLAVSDGSWALLQSYRLIVVCIEFRRPPGVGAVVASGAINTSMTCGITEQFLPSSVVHAVALFAAGFFQPGLYSTVMPWVFSKT